MTLLALVLTAGILTAMGFAMLTIIAPDVPLWWFERAAVSYVLGIGCGALVWTASMPMFGVVDPRAALVAFAGLLGAAAVVRFRPRPSPQPEEPLARWLVVGGVCVLALACATMIAATLHEPLGWDGLFNQEFKARLAFEHAPRGRLPLPYLSDASRAWSHPGYPPLVPSAEFWFYAWRGGIDQHAVKLLAPVYFFAIVGAASGAIRRLTDARTAMLMAVVLAWGLPLSVDLGTTGYADIPLASSFAVALACVTVALISSDARMFVLAGACAAVCAWTKSEGFLLALCLGAALALAARPVPFVARSAVVWMPVLAIAPWLVVQHMYGMRETDFPSFAPAVALAHLDRLPMIVGLVLRALARPGRWGLLWPTFAVAGVWMLWRHDTEPVGVVLMSAVVAPLTAFTLVYLFSSWTDVGEHVRTSIDRLLTPLSSAALLFSVSRAWRSFT